MSDVSRLERRLWVLATAAFLLAAAGDRVPLVRGPAPYPPEWQWPLREAPWTGPWWPAVLCAGGILGLLAASASAPARARPRSSSRLLLLVGTVFGLAFPLALVAGEGDGPLRTLFGRVAYRTATSYYTVAIAPEAADPFEFLRRHHELLPGFRKGAKHAATHPPGPVLVYRALLEVSERSPRLMRAVLRLAGLPESNPRRARLEHPPAARAAGVMGALLILAGAVLTAWVVAGLAVALGCGALPAARLGLLWLLLPGPVLMLPQFDQFLALLVSLATFALLRALRPDAPRRGVGWSVAAGLLGGAATALSYGAPAFLAIGGISALCAARARALTWAEGLRRCAVAGAVTFLTFLAPALAGHHPFASAREALRIHREFFTEPRSYVLWLAFDPLDLAVFVGLPVALALLWGTVAAARRLVAHASLGVEEAFRLGAVAALALLLLSGQTRGEVGRIWIPIMPLLLVAALARAPRAGAEGGPSAATALLIAALLVPVDLALAAWWRFF
ncbi:MAG TPA: hypothetical protein VMR21_05625 [Vicinamibacteria bacterium]|nr:hypothetical protein [Vicinamibacteria bacterium]